MIPSRQRCRTRSHPGESGFTLIELLVVVVILGVLIAIAIPLYLNYQKSAYLTSAKADLHTLQLEEEAYIATNGSYGPTLQIIKVNPNLKLSRGSFGAVVWSSPNGYCVAALNRNGPADPAAPFAVYGYGFKTYYYTSTTGAISDVVCSVPTGATPFDNHYVDDTGVH